MRRRNLSWPLLAFFALLAGSAEGVILPKCTLVKELERAGVSRSMISNWVCMAQSESGLDTRLVTGPRGASSCSYGIFQITSGKHCSRGHAGGFCNKRCEIFADDNIQDDIDCAKKIVNSEGFKAWKGWLNKCKSKPLPNISGCKRR